VRLFQPQRHARRRADRGALAGALAPRATLAILVVALVASPVQLLLLPIGRVRDVAALAQRAA